MSATCARCGQPARGLATIGDDRYCHEGDDPTCYQLASWERSGIDPADPLGSLFEPGCVGRE